MKIEKPAVAGTLESSDAMVTIEPNEEGGITLELDSSVIQQYGRKITEVVLETLERLEVSPYRGQRRTGLYPKSACGMCCIPFQ